MPESIIFNIRESLRNIKNLSKSSIFYFFSLSVSHLLLMLVIIIYINTYYYRHIIAESKDSATYNIVFFFLILVVSGIFIYTNQGFIKKYLENNRDELKLIKALKGRTDFIKYPLILSCFSINLTALLIIFYYISSIYRYMMRNIDTYYLLDFDYYDTSLFFILLIYSTLVIFCLSCFLFHRFENREK